MSEDEIVAIIAAQPEWKILEPITEDGKVVKFVREPIIAWRIESSGKEHAAYPITANASPDPDWPTQRPDGTLFTPIDQDFESEDALLKYLNRRSV